MDRRHLRQLVGHADGERPLRRGSRACGRRIRRRSPAGSPADPSRSSAAAPLWASILGELTRVRNVQRALGEFDSGMPFAEDERSFRRYDDRQRGQRSPGAQRSGKMAGVVFALDRPAEGEAAAGKAGKRALEEAVHPSTPGIEHRRVRSRDRAAISRSRSALRQAFSVVGSMGDALSFMIFKVFRNLAAACAAAFWPPAALRAQRIRSTTSLLGRLRRLPRRRPDQVRKARHEARRPRARALARLLAAVDAAGGRLQPRSARVLRHARRPLCQRAPAQRLAARARQAQRLAGVRPPGGALHARRPRSELLSLDLAPRARRRQRARRSDGDVARAGRAAGRLPAPEHRSFPRAAGCRSPTSGAACACCSSTARSPRRRPRSRCCRRSEAPDERMLAEAARQPKRLLERLPKVLETPRGARSRGARPRCATRATMPPAPPRARTARSPSGSRESELQLPLGPGRLRGRARAPRATRSSGSRAPATAPLDDRHLAWKVRAALRAGQWQVVRESIDRMSLAAAHHPAWIYWYGRALAAQGEEMGSRAYLPAHRRPERFLRPARERGARLPRGAARRRRMCRASRKSPPPATSRAWRARSS